jgi:hypothetical protein
MKAKQVAGGSSVTYGVRAVTSDALNASTE